MKKQSFKEKLRDWVYDKMDYSVKRHSIIVKVLKVLTEKHKSVLLRYIVLLQARLARMISYFWM